MTKFSREYLEALRQKLIEEAQEAALASPKDLVKELADLYEVIDAVLVAYPIEREVVLAVQKQRRVWSKVVSRHEVAV